MNHRIGMVTTIPILFFISKLHSYFVTDYLIPKSISMKKLKIFLLYILLSIPITNLFSQNFLTSQGNKLIDSKGNTVRLTGVNWFGFETNLKYPHGIWARDCKSMLKQIKDNGFNCIRFPYSNDILKPDALISINSFGTDPYTGVTPMNQIESTFTNPLQLLDKIVEYCQQLNLKIILDNHSRKSDNYLNESLWYTADVSEAKWIYDWVTLASRYKNNDAVIAMDLDNEPNGSNGQGCTWGNTHPLTDWNKAAERCGNAILNVNPNVLIMIEGIQTYNGDGYWWGGNLKGVADFPVVLSNPKKLIFSPHEYGPEVFNQTWFTDPAFPGNMAAIWNTHFDFLYSNNTSPLLVGEFGIRDLTSYNGTEGKWFDTLLAFMGARYSWTFWCWNPNSGDTGGLLDDQWLNPVQWKINKLKPYMASEIPNSSSGNNSVSVSSVVVTPATATLAINGATQLIATISPSNASNKTVSWSSNNVSVATVSSTGLVTGITTGSATITVITQDGAKTSTCAVIVSTGIISVTGVTVSPLTDTLSIGLARQLTATVAPASATNKSVSWSSSNTTIATVNSSGLVTGVAGGTATITVTTQDGAKTAASSINVKGGTIPCSFGTPLSNALPSINKSYANVYVIGSGGPNMANLSTFTINWDLPNKGLYQFSANTKDGKPNWYVDLRTGAIQTLGSVQPSITLVGTGFAGLDGSYYAAIDNGNFVLASKTGGFTIYFSSSSTAPTCTKKAHEMSQSLLSENVVLFPNPFLNEITLQENAEPISSVKVYDQFGKEVLTLGISGSKGSTIKFGKTLAIGIYIVKVYRNSKVDTYKIIKQ